MATPKLDTPNAVRLILSTLGQWRSFLEAGNVPNADELALLAADMDAMHEAATVLCDWLAE